MNGYRYYSTRDNGMHFSIFHRRHDEWVVRSAFNKLDLMSAVDSRIEIIAETLHEARQYVKARISVLEANG